MKTISKVWGNLYSSLGQINSKCPLENALVKRIMRPQQYRERAKVVTERINAQDTILEIGCGYGGLAQEILKIMPVSYTMVDNKPMLTLAKKFLGDRVKYIEAEKIEMLQDRKFGLFISVYCLSETPAEYREYVLKEIIKNCRKIFIIDLDDTVKPTPKMLKDGWEMLPMNIEKWIEKYFIFKKNKHRRTKYITYMGERKK